MKIRLLNHVALLALSATLFTIGCKPGGQGRIASASSRTPSSTTAAAQYAAMGETAIRGRNGPMAVAMAERAVAAQPGVGRYRAQLGQSYLLAGRFASAIDAFRDALAIAPDDGRTLLGMALAQAALDRQDAARASVAAATGRIGAPDRGLALALAGDTDGAIALLEPAVRRSDATPKTRQNLALAYALAGRWDVARTTASQDLPADRIDARMQAWAALARPQPRVDRVAAFLGVTPVAIDEGMPTQLALGVVPTVTAVAAPVARPVAAPVALPNVVPVVAPTRVAAMDVVPVAVPAPVVEPAPVPMMTAKSGSPPALLVRPAAPPAPMPIPSPERVSFVAPSRSIPPVAPPALLMRTAYVAPVPRRGRWAVQLGAFSSGRSIEAAWARVSRAVRPVAGMVPLSSTVRTRAGLFQRLAVGGLGSRAEAVALCEQVRAARGVCFVRTTSGEAPMQMAGGRRPGTRMASR